MLLRHIPIYLLIVLNLSVHTLFSQDEIFKTHFEKSNGTETPEYAETIDFYKKLATHFQTVEIKEMGVTDSGFPLHIVLFNPDRNFDFNNLQKTKRIILINNGIHPGESDGIDASMLLFRDLATGKIKNPEGTILATIPVYNIGGALQRNSTTRTNQNGPKEYGFRGNARNYDLNRDFIKNDTKNARSFAKIFHLVNPDVFIDTHVSNGADYQYTLTHLLTQHNKLGGALGGYWHEKFQPQLEQSLQLKNWDITPYVNVWGTTPDKGWTQLMDAPRYSTGYTTLWNTLGLMVETHMLKSYEKRVTGTYELLKSVITIVESDGEKIRKLRNDQFDVYKNLIEYPVQWKADTSKHSTLRFKGYEGTYTSSQLTGKKRLKYDASKPYQKDVHYRDYFTPTKKIEVPKTYVIPQGWWQVIELLKINNIELKTLRKDTVISVQSYEIKNYKTVQKPYEGHYTHYNTEIEKTLENRTFKKGDFLISLPQKGMRYLMETLEPEAIDSFFNWNFFDTILQQKEHFSPYVWEDKALEILKNNPALKQEFEAQKKDTAFANDSYQQLDWLHKKSAHYEKAHLQYPVYRILR